MIQPSVQQNYSQKPAAACFFNASIQAYVLNNKDANGEFGCQNGESEPDFCAPFPAASTAGGREGAKPAAAG